VRALRPWTGREAYPAKTTPAFRMERNSLEHPVSRETLPVVRVSA